MAKLYFRYGAMNSGKSTAMLQAAYNYEERGHRVLLAKPAIDTKGDMGILSRLGVTRDVDFLIAPETDAYGKFQQHRERTLKRFDRDVSALLVDEAQFLTEAQIDDLLRIALLENIPVLAYGIRTDFQTVAFPGSRRLLEVAHSLEELKTICRCGRKAIFNARTIDGVFVFDGAQVAIDGVDVAYESLCGNCYLQESRGVLNNGRRRWPVDDAATAYDNEPDPDFT
ncbi:thymidine kinase [Leifsonia sp. LS1]|uniref:thymidine kinase n=1 Tax=unclassified Leifsonia TaxID=2663824 RepID=UPI001CBC0852|nr:MULTISPECIES: thymidine kinase [unclassified Leifsonia]UAJ80429.1 thymidine kinase [Leifsonia sp. ZF2019]GIT80927.1 thymidine kinase [Leifsonia sp. LS1]